MELSESVQKGLKLLADPSVFDPRGFSVLLDVSFLSLLSAHGDAAVLDHPELKNHDSVLLKQSHAAVVTFILECVKLNTDKSTLSSCLEELSYSAEKIEIFHSEYEKHKTDIVKLLSCIGRRRPEINDVSWRLQYQIKSGQVDKVDEPFYLITLNTENEARTCEDVNFTCTVEQLQDLVGKLKDAAKSMERASQM
ncbi:COMM domain-containing protein 3 isoform X1 [Eucyclogobius newberryi]|uniref:COMM domain-containing protein 3 isoform X1 n=1 Tax=Eucyclogobius newberryi TaxID=166745 RepID=UPI003B5B655E